MGMPVASQARPGRFLWQKRRGNESAPSDPGNGQSHQSSIAAIATTIHNRLSATSGNVMEDRHSPRDSARTAAPQPFWQRLPAIALYPLRGAALFSLIILTLCSLLTLIPVAGWFIGIIVWVAVYRYSFEILRHTANGHMDAPETALGSGDGTVWRLIVLMILFGTVVALTAIFTALVPTQLVILVLALLQPGCIIALTLDGSLRRAANPLVALEMALRIGWPYLAAFGLLFVIQASAATATGWLENYLPPIIADQAITVVAIWGLFATFHLMGYLVYQYHEALGYEPIAGKDRIDRHAPDRHLLEEAEQFVRDGHIDTALQMLRAEVRSRAVGLPVHEFYQRLLRQGKDGDELRNHARQYIHRLIDEKQERRALALLREALDSDPDFVPLLPEQASQLAERAKMAGQFQLTADTLRAAIRAWPKSPQTAQWSLDTALLLAERYGRDDEARTLLNQALEHCDDEDQKRKLEAALKAIAIAPATT